MYKYYIHENSQLYNQWKQKPKNSYYDSKRFTKMIITKGYHECEFNVQQPHVSTNEWVVVRLATEPYIGQYLPTPTRKWRTWAVKWKSSFYCRYMDATFIVCKDCTVHLETLKLFNEIHPAIRFTCKGENRREIYFLMYYVQKD